MFGFSYFDILAHGSPSTATAAREKLPNTLGLKALDFLAPENEHFLVSKNKNGVLWSQARMRIEIRLRCYLVIWSLVICN